LRFLVFGGWFGSGNVGDDAILIGLRRILHKAVPDSEITAISINPEQTIRICGVRAIPLLSPLGPLRRGVEPIRAYLKTFRDTDACIVSGGNPVYDYDHLSRSLHFSLSSLLGSKLLCFGIGVKPITSPVGLGLIKTLLGRADLISVRDHISKSELLKMRINTCIRVTGDSSLFMEPASPRDGLRKLIEVGVDISKPMVAVCARALSAEYRKHYHEPIKELEIFSIRKALAGIADHLLKMGFEVVFLPMHRDPFDDDLKEISFIIGQIGSSEPKVMQNELSPEEVLAVLGKMRLVVGLRLHSLIFAARQGVPIVSIDYDPKIRGFMELAEVGGYLCNPVDPVESLIGKAEAALTESDSITSRLFNSCRTMRLRIEAEARRVAKVLG
jgi:polysaccharide pyruvyl transferase WcaK-like protein